MTLSRNHPHQSLNANISYTESQCLLKHFMDFVSGKFIGKTRTKTVILWHYVTMSYYGRCRRISSLLSSFFPFAIIICHHKNCEHCQQKYLFIFLSCLFLWQFRVRRFFKGRYLWINLILFNEQFIIWAMGIELQKKYFIWLQFLSVSKDRASYKQKDAWDVVDYCRTNFFTFIYLSICY